MATHRDYDTDKIIFGRKKAKTAYEALLKANELREEILWDGGYLEYGIEFTPLTPPNKDGK